MARNRDPFVAALRTLRERVVTGVFSPGRPIIILDEAKALGLSTTPVREALAWLGGEGLIERAPAGGYSGLKLDPAGLAGRYRLRRHCLREGLARAALVGCRIEAPDDPEFFFRQIVAASADAVIVETFDRVQATLAPFAAMETDLVGDMPDSLQVVARLLRDSALSEAALALDAFHERRIEISPLLCLGAPPRAGAG
nr:GntR family transcriptional regulator [uncultured Brevundimonas sp.]